MDGNRRWAQERGKLKVEGHLYGHDKAVEVLRWCKDEGISHVVLYAFSTENWNRSPEEVSYFLDLLTNKLPDLGEAQEQGGEVVFIGDSTRFGEPLASVMRGIEQHNPSNPTHTIAIALSYGGRLEIVTAVNKLLASGKTSVCEDDVAKALWTCDIPDPDLIIRTGGEQRLSNFLPWQSVYSELFFTPTYWPEFSKEEFVAILDEYASRERRHGH
ncbi:MAG: undecaprenyl diphosphate synthase [Patescibacteria group bacterium]|nr:undecaprenyl diphosphate synthase [Patescibacteria group bacterium]